MMEFKEVLRDISCELDKGEYYAGEAKKHKAEYPDLAAIYAKVATAHKDNAEMLLHQAEAMTSRAEREKHADAMGMAAVFEYAEERAEMDMEAIDRKLTHYRNE